MTASKEGRTAGAIIEVDRLDGRFVFFLAVQRCPKMNPLTNWHPGQWVWNIGKKLLQLLIGWKGLVLPLTMIFWTIWWLLFWDSWSILQTVVFVQSYGHRRCALLVGWDWLSIWGLWQNHPFWPPDPPGATPVAAHKYTASWNTSITTEYTSHPATNTRKTVHINRVS